MTEPYERSQRCRTSEIRDVWECEQQTCSKNCCGASKRSGQSSLNRVSVEQFFDDRNENYSNRKKIRQFRRIRQRYCALAERDIGELSDSSHADLEGQ